MHLARLEMRRALATVLDRLPHVRLDPEATDVHVGGLGFRAANRLPVLFDPIPR
jgi:cytochrome P450